MGPESPVPAVPAPTVPVYCLGVDERPSDRVSEPPFVPLGRPAAVSSQPIEHRWVHKHPERVDGFLACASAS
jgi:hypothetical protein